VFGIEFFDPQTVWVNVTNFILGVVTLACIAAVAWGVLVEVAARVRAHARVVVPDSHSYEVPGLGLTMADGGEKLDEEEEKK
jgi:hypothetical protein